MVGALCVCQERTPSTMNIAKVEVTDFQSLQDLKPFLEAPGPCLSVYMTLVRMTPTEDVKTNALQWKELVQTLEPAINEQGASARELLAGISDWDVLVQDQPVQGKALAAFRAPDTFQLTWLQQEVRNRAIAAPHFYIRPLLGELACKKFYVLALSQKNVRLLRCTLRSSEEVPLPLTVSTSFDAYMDTAKPDHVRSNISSAGPSAGHTKGVGGTTDTQREDKPEYLAHFFRQIDRGVNEVLRANGNGAPLVLAGVEYELAQYATLNTYPHLLAETVQGAPNSLKSGEMHTRAIDALNRHYGGQIDGFLAEYNHKAGSGASNRLSDVVVAAHEGRVLSLLISDTLECSGVFDESTYQPHLRAAAAAQEDLVNDAALQTILHAGQVFVGPNNRLPDGAPAAAIFRY
jgi:hypothetical protein